MDIFNGAKKLGFGLMRLPLTDPNDEGSIDIEAAKKMVDSFIEQGFTYFDTAWMYHNFKSEEAAKEILTSRYPRDSYTLATKLHAGFINSKEDREKVFQEQLRKTGAEYFDYYLLHDVGAERYPKYEELDCFGFMAEKKAQGLVKHIGFSMHDSPEMLDKVLTEHPEVEFVQLQVNWIDWDSPGIRAGEACAVAEKHGVPVIVMEPVKGGTLAQRVPAEAVALRSYDLDPCQADVPGVVDLNPLRGLEYAVREIHPADRHLRQAVYVDRAGRPVAYDPADVDVPELGRGLIHLQDIPRTSGRDAFRLHLADRLPAVIEVEDNRVINDVLHPDVFNPYVFYDSSASSGTLEAQSNVGAVEDAVAYLDVLHSSAHLASYHESAVSAINGAIAYEKVPALNRVPPAVLVLTGLYAYGIVSHIE